MAHDTSISIGTLQAQLLQKDLEVDELLTLLQASQDRIASLEATVADVSSNKTGVAERQQMELLILQLTQDLQAAYEQNQRNDQTALVAKLRQEIDGMREALLRKDDELREQMQEALLARDRSAKSSQQYSSVMASLEERERRVQQQELSLANRLMEAERREADIQLQERVYDETVIAAAAKAESAVETCDSETQTDEMDHVSFGGLEWQRRLSELSAMQEMLKRHEDGLDRRAGSISAREKLVDETAQQRQMQWAAQEASAQARTAALQLAEEKFQNQANERETMLVEAVLSLEERERDLAAQRDELEEQEERIAKREEKVNREMTELLQLRETLEQAVPIGSVHKKPRTPDPSPRLRRTLETDRRDYAATLQNRTAEARAHALAERIKVLESQLDEATGLQVSELEDVSKAD